MEELNDYTRYAFWQLIHRRPDEYGNPYTLVMAGGPGIELTAYESRSNDPEIVKEFKKLNIIFLCNVCVSPAQYESLRESCGSKVYGID